LKLRLFHTLDGTKPSHPHRNLNFERTSEALFEKRKTVVLGVYYGFSILEKTRKKEEEKTSLRSL